MQKWLDNNDTLIYSTRNESKSVVAERFIKTLKSKIYKKLTANNKKFYLGFLNKLVDEYNNTYHRSVGKKPVNADYFTSTKEIEMSPKSPKFNVGDRVRTTKYKNFFSKGYTKNWSKEIFVIDFMLKLILGRIKLNI